jgi:hypothetical protein
MTYLSRAVDQNCLTAARAGYRVQSFIRMKRIFRIALIAQRGVTVIIAGPGFFGNCRSGCYRRDSMPYPETNKTKRSRPAEWSYGAQPIDQSNQENPIHPDETLNSVARRYGGQK